MASTLIQTTEGVAPRERWYLWKALVFAAVDASPSGDASDLKASRRVDQLVQGPLIGTAAYSH